MNRIYRYFKIILLTLLSSCSSNEENSLVVKFENGKDLVKGTQVTLNEFIVGKVETVELSHTYEVLALIKLDRDLRIPKGSRFILDNSSIFSTGIIIEPNNSDIYLKNGDTIKGERFNNSFQDRFDEVIYEIMKNAVSLKYQDSILNELKELNLNLEKIKSKN